MARLTLYCWHCYCANSPATDECVQCGRAIQRPAKASYGDQLIWALGHPIPDTQMIAAQILGRRRALRGSG
jgi:hypothetical protein